MAKNASVVAAITDQNMPPSAFVRNCTTRDTSPWPNPIAQSPITMMISSPVSSTQVRTTFAFTLSPTPRKLTAAMMAMKTRPVAVIPTADRLSPIALDMFAAKAREAVDAEVMPEHITANATMNVTK